MRFIGDRLRAIGRPFAWVFTRSSYNVGFLRTLAAPRWRKLVRWTVVAIGFSTFIFLEIVLAYLCNQLMWYYIVAFMIVVACLVFAASRPTATFIVWLIFSPLGFLFLRMDFGESLPAITFDRVALTAIAGFLLLRTMLERQRIKKPLIGEWMILALIFYTCLMLYAMQTGSLTNMLKTISERFDHIGLAVIAYYIAKSVLVTRKHLTWALIGLVITGLYVSVSAFYEHFTGTMWFSSFIPGNYHLSYDDVGRAAGPLLNPAAMGAFLGITAFISYHLAGSVERKDAKIFFIVATMLQFIGCYFCLTRSGYASAALLFCLMPFFTKSYRKHYLALVAGVVVVGIVVVPLMFSNKLVEKRLTTSSTILYRLAVTYSTINIIKHHPIFGIGLGEIDHGIAKYITNVGTLSGIYARGVQPSLMYPQQKLGGFVTSHNSILTIFAEQGFIGGLLYVGAIIAFMLHLIGVRARLPDKGLFGKDIIALLIIACIGHVISIMGYDVRFFKYPNYVFWVLFAIGVRLGEIAAEEVRLRVAEEIAISEPITGGLVHA